MTVSIITSYRYPDKLEAPRANTGVLPLGRSRERRSKRILCGQAQGYRLSIFDLFYFSVEFANILPIFYLKRLRTGEHTQGYIANVK